MYRTSRNGTVITCEECGQVGLPIVNVGTQRKKRYVCKEPDPCTRRKSYRKTHGVLCSYWFCTDPAEVTCSCGMTMCVKHRLMATHVSHKKTRIGEESNAKK